MIARIFFLTCVLCCLWCREGASSEWTLEKTIDVAREVSNQMDIEQYEAEKADIDAVTYNKKWLPSLDVSATAKYVSEVMEINIPFKTITFGGHDLYDFSVTLNQLIYDGGRLRALMEAGEKRSLTSRYTTEAIGLGVEFQAKVAFFSVVIAEKALQVASQSLEEAKRHLHDITARFEQGMALENDVLRAKLRVSNAEMDIVSKNAGIEKGKAAFRKIAGLGADEEVTIVWDEERGMQTIDREIWEQFSERRPEFRAYDSAITASEKRMRVLKADYYPGLGLFGRFNYGKPGLDLPDNEWMHYFSSGVTLNWNAWDWGETKREIDKASLDKKRIQKNRDEFKLALTQQITEALAEYREAQRRMKLAEEAESLARKQMELTHSAFGEGAATETDFDNAHTMFTKATYEKAISKVSLWMCAAKVDYMLGIRYSGGTHE